MTHALPPRLQALADALPKLSAKDREFGQSLLTQAFRRPLSDKQLYWVDTLAARATEATRPTAATVDTSGIHQLFDRAAKNLKRPAIVLGVENFGEIKVNLPGAQSANVGGLYIKGTAGDYLGKVDSAGSVRLLREVPEPKKAAITGLLARFAAEPAKVAAEHGHLTGRCCFCSLPLSDERSTLVGYGRTCAQNWGLPYPTAQEAKLAANAA